MFKSKKNKEELEQACKDLQDRFTDKELKAIYKRCKKCKRAVDLKSPMIWLKWLKRFTFLCLYLFLALVFVEVTIWVWDCISNKSFEWPSFTFLKLLMAGVKTMIGWLSASKAAIEQAVGVSYIFQGIDYYPTNTDLKGIIPRESLL